MFTAAELSTVGGIATVSLLHSFIPTHWLPFSVVGRAQKWTISRTLFVTALGAFCHVLSTALLGFTALTMANTLASEETVHTLASLLLVVLGCAYLTLFLLNRRGLAVGLAHCNHGSSQQQQQQQQQQKALDKMAVAGLVLLPTLSPCATTLPVFLAVGNASKSFAVFAMLVLLLCTLAVMLTLVALSFYGASQLKFRWVERYDKPLVGAVLCLVGILTFFFHSHDHHHHHEQQQQAHSLEAAVAAIHSLNQH